MGIVDPAKRHARLTVNSAGVRAEATLFERALSSTTIPVLGRSFNIGRYVGVVLPGVNASGPTTPRAGARTVATAGDGGRTADRQTLAQ